MGQFGADLWAYCVLGVVLIVAGVTDIRSGKIYNWTTYPAVAVGLIGHVLLGGLWGGAGRDGIGSPGTMGLFDALLGLAAGFVPLLLAWWAGGIGGGDAKIMGAVGALAGWRFALTAMFYGFFVALLMAVALMIRRRIVRDTLGRIGRFIFLWLVRTRPANPATEQSPTLPFGLALCIGAAAALLLVCIFGPGRKMFILGI